MASTVMVIAMATVVIELDGPDGFTVAMDVNDEVCQAAQNALNLVTVEFSDLDGLGKWTAPPSDRMKKIRDCYDEWNNDPKSARGCREILDRLVQKKNDLKDAIGDDRSLMLQYDAVDELVDESIRHLQEFSEQHPSAFRTVQAMAGKYHLRS